MGDLKREVNAARVTGQATQDKVAAMDTRMEKLSTAFEEFVIQQKQRDKAADDRRHATPQTQKGSSTDAPTRIPTHRFIGTPHETSPQRAHTQPEAIRTKLVKFPYPVDGDHMKTVYSHIRDYWDDAEMWRDALPNFPSGGAQFGILFHDRASAVKFAEYARQKPYTYDERVTIRVTPPKAPESKRKGILASKVYAELNRDSYTGTLRTMYSRSGAPTATINTVTASGRLRELATIGYDGEGDNMTIGWIDLCDHLRSHKELVRAIAKAKGVRPRNATKRNADDMAQ